MNDIGWLLDSMIEDVPIAPTSHRFNVVVQSPTLYREVDQNGETTLRRARLLVAPNCLDIFSFSRTLAGRSWTAILFSPYNRTLICSPPSLVSSSSFSYLQAATFTLTPAPSLFAQQTPNTPALSAPVRLGEPQSNAAASRGGSTPPAPDSLDPL